jgi:hypothetical protein
MALPCAKQVLEVQKSFPIPACGQWPCSTGSGQKMSNIGAPTVLHQHPQSLKMYCHLYDPHSHFAENESCKMSYVCN